MGFAVVQGTLRTAGGVAIGDKQVYVNCPVAGAYDQRTNSRGEFRITVIYAALDGPPPLDPDGMFRLACNIFAVGLRARDTLTVPFARSPDAVVPVVIYLREPS